MLKRDFIMVQIEELGKVMVQIIDQRNNNTARRIPELIQTVYDSLKIERNDLLASSPEALKTTLDGDDGEGLPRLEIAAKLLMEDAYLHPDNQSEIRQKAKEILEYIQTHDNTFSLERINLLQELSSFV